MLLIRNADTFAPRPLGLRNLLLGGGRILWVGAPSELPDLPAALRAASRTIDLEGRRLIPGLIDGHVHVTGGGGEAGFRTRVPPVPLTRFTASGITTVIGLLGTDDVARTTRDLVATVHALREEGLNAWAYTGGYHLPPMTLTGSVRGDLVFIEPLLGVGEVALSDHRSSQPTLDEILRLAADAHVAGLMTGKAGVLHLHMGDGKRGLELVRRAIAETELPPRVFNPTHVNRRRALFDEAVALAKSGCTVDITAFPVAEGEDAYSAADALRRYVDSGAPAERVTVSSDAGGCLPCFDADGRVCRMDVGAAGALLGTIRVLLAAGLPLERVLPAFTVNPARLLRLAGKGEIAVGGDADLVALDAKDGAHTVIIRGIVHVQDGAPVRRGTFEA
ncbi:MAG: beta-aspartyl-peptidase [Gammaproteobacteria bacterium]|nr:beta-aspartyl-peptidase [Gammaproteobacteria bacterium]